jgi:hypothetical protein
MTIQERPWMPGPNLPWRMVLANPEGDRHLAFESGQWLRIFEDLRSQPLTPGEAMALRPSDIDTIIRWTVVYGRTNPGEQADSLIDEMATGVRVLVTYLITRGG